MSQDILESFYKLKNFILDETSFMSPDDFKDVRGILLSAEGRDKLTLVHLLNVGYITKNGSRSGTLLHLVSDAQVWNLGALKLLLECKADPGVPDGNRCYCNSCNDKAANCVKLLLERSTNSKDLVDMKDSLGDTALHLAARNLFPKPAAVMLDFDADIFIQNKIQLQSKPKENLLTTIVQAIPSVLLVRLDRAVGEEHVTPTHSLLYRNFMKSNTSTAMREDFRSKGYSTDMTLAIDLSFLTQKKIEEGPDGNPIFTRGRESEFIVTILKAHKIAREKLFSHPVTEAFLYKKWSRVRWWFMISRSIFFIFACFYTNFVFIYYLQNCPYQYKDDGSSGTGDVDGSSSSYQDRCDPWIWNKIYGYLMSAFVGLMILTQVSNMNAQRREYLDHKAWALAWWLLIIGVGCTSISPIFHWYPTNWMHSAASVTVFWFWTMLLATYTRIPQVANYVQMLIKVIKTVLFCVWVYGAIVLGFGFGFHVMFPENQEFKSPVLSFVKLLLMMLGESDYEGLLQDNKNEDTAFTIPAHLFYSAFLILVTIVFMNLLIGLSVSDIQDMIASSRMAGIAGQVNAIDTLERQIFSGWGYRMCCGTRLLYFLQDTFCVVTSFNQYLRFRPYDPNDNIIDKKLQFKLLHLYKSSFHRDSNSHVYASPKLTHELLDDRLKEVFQD